MLGAFQVWHNAIKDQARAVVDYRGALSLGATAPLPQLFASAGIKFTFDAKTLQQAVDLAEKTIKELDATSNDQSSM
jgi:oligoendopeptidase F